jgi:hypothetical protein
MFLFLSEQTSLRIIFDNFISLQSATHGNRTLFLLSGPPAMTLVAPDGAGHRPGAGCSWTFGLAPCKEADSSPVDRKPSECLHLSTFVCRMKSTNWVSVEVGLSSPASSTLQKSVCMRKPSSTEGP